MKETNYNASRKSTKPKWLIQLEVSINNVRKQIGQLTTVIECLNKGMFTKHQNRLKQIYTKKYGNSKRKTFEYKLSMLKQSLRAKTTKLKYKNRMFEWKKINNKFMKSPKSVYRSMKGNNISVNELPTKEKLETFWKGLWNKESKFN